MIIVMKVSATKGEIDSVCHRLENMKFSCHVIRGVNQSVIGVIGEITDDLCQQAGMWPQVEKALRVGKPYKLVSKECQPQGSIVKVKSVTIGQDKVVIAGPCAVETENQMLKTAEAVKKAGANMLRGGAFKPRTSPYAFQGLKEKGLELLKEAGDLYDLPVVTEVVDPRDVELVTKYADMLQIGARNMQNFSLLQEVGQTNKPILLKRGLSSTVQEWLMAAEYIMAEGNSQVVLCERGIRTFEPWTRNTLDVSAIALAKEVSHLPVLADPSHASGKRSLVEPLAKAALAVGADGLIIEVHPNPDQALSDGPQSLNFAEFAEFMAHIGIN
ncbi:MAG TPA: 3-deoxy-7-phosphoheptulonate synthase, partial [Firmicutes bacterium]|nr:3-deoxy-7-phosphoheptulonate synthase [Bacillota bacterium]